MELNYKVPKKIVLIISQCKSTLKVCNIHTPLKTAFSKIHGSVLILLSLPLLSLPSLLPSGVIPVFWSWKADVKGGSKCSDRGNFESIFPPQCYGLNIKVLHIALTKINGFSKWQDGCALPLTVSQPSSCISDKVCMSWYFSLVLCGRTWTFVLYMACFVRAWKNNRTKAVCLTTASL